MKLKPALMGLKTILGLKKLGYFIPYRYAATSVDNRKVYLPIKVTMDKHVGNFEKHIHEIEKYRDDLLNINGGDLEKAGWQQDWYPRLDAATAYTMVRRFKPKRILEIGSGHSTRFMYRAVVDRDLNTEITAIDPAPRASISALPVKIYQTILQDVELELFDTLKPGDFLCIDSSHILMPGTDVDIVLNHILGGLPSGVIVFFHDIFLPYPYPDSWKWRGYNEQNAISALLQGGYEPLFASQYALKNMSEQLKESVINELPLIDNAPESGLWLRKN
ncbi:class I SAM-dependent methyltransferase [Kiloniella sp.]|uniref:class I SAM-dependent methyltransferase n=1 Tax=Kiloniella sp. TaxID=1938587 RepID=UPI003B01D26A